MEKEDLDGQSSDSQKNIDREIHIENLKREASRLVGGDMSEFVSGECPPELEEAFWENVVRFEQGPFTTLFDQLVKEGVELPPPDHLDDEALTAKLWSVIHKLAEMRVFLSSTNHLGDRDLYRHLWEESLREERPVMPPHHNWNCHIDILGGCSEDDIVMQMKYYADEKEREDWMSQFPDFEMPSHEDPPYDRDEYLPQASYGRAGWDEFDKDDDEEDIPWDADE